MEPPHHRNAPILHQESAMPFAPLLRMLLTTKMLDLIYSALQTITPMTLEALVDWKLKHFWTNKESHTPVDLAI